VASFETLQNGQCDATQLEKFSDENVYQTRNISEPECPAKDTPFFRSTYAGIAIMVVRHFLAIPHGRELNE
jgi:hypothetical protein